ncbi:MAG: pyrroline-5-carboxylate reductase [Kiloniellales bacterium]
MDIGGALLLVGCGKMGGALLGGWLERGLAPERVTVVEPLEASVAGFAARGVAAVAEAGALAPDAAPAVVVLAVKPQQMDAAMPGLARFARPGTVFLSIAAGKNIGYFEGHLGAAAAIVRAMPNTPAAVGRGMTVLCANPHVGAAQRTACGDLLAAVGETAWVEDEALLDPVTAVSGGGPAYVFLLIECLAEAGTAAGLPAELAMRLARVTVAGSGELVHRAPEPAGTLRENVTSPGGTTLEALKVLMAPDGLQPLMTRAIAEATRRSRELAS